MTIKQHLTYKQEKPNNNMNSYLLNHTSRMGVLATFQEIEIIPSTILELNEYKK